MLEYNSPVWSPSLKKDIILIESVQRHFTKRIPGLATMTYHSRLKLLNLESLEVRKLRADLVLAYKILFGVTCIESDTLFMLRNQPHLRGHNYTLTKPRCASQVRRCFLVQQLSVCGTICLPTLQTLVVCASFALQSVKTTYLGFVLFISCDVCIILTHGFIVILLFFFNA